MALQFVESINFILERSMIETIRRSDYFSILIDESMDISKHENLIIYARYYDDIKCIFKTSYLKLLRIKDQSGAQIFLMLKNFLLSKGLNVKSCFGFGSDGASNMTGYRKGVFAFLKKENPYIILQHCANHRLALAHSDTGKEVKYLKEYIDIINDTYAFFSKSPRRNILLKKFQHEVMEPELNVLRLCPTRWLSLSQCVRNIRKMFQSLVLSFDEEINSEDHGLTEASKEKYEAVYFQICEYKFIAFTYFLLDILGIVDKLCYELQADELNYENYATSVSTCFDEIQENYLNKNFYGDNYRKFKSDLEKKRISPEHYY